VPRTNPLFVRAAAGVDYAGFAAHRLRQVSFALAANSLALGLRGALDSGDGRATLISLGWRQQDSGTPRRTRSPASASWASP